MLYALLMVAACAASALQPTPVTDVARTSEGGAFVRNLGQWSPAAEFRLGLPGLDLWLVDSGFVCDIHTSGSPLSTITSSSPFLPNVRLRGSVVRTTFRGMLPSATGFGAEGRVTTRYNYLKGNSPRGWLHDVPGYQRVVRKGLYRGIDLDIGIDQGRPRYNFLVEPRGNPSSIQMAFDGASALSIDRAGALVVATSFGGIEHRDLRAWQMVHGRRRSVDCRFVLLDAKSVGFVCGAYDHQRPLVIDPILFSTMIGGGDYERPGDFARDSSDGLYIVGSSFSRDFPTTPGAYDTSFSKAGDAFVVKVDRNSGQTIFSTLIGGDGGEGGNAIAVGKDGSIYLAGLTASKNFPTTEGVVGREFNDSIDAFVARLDATGSRLLFSSYIGGEGIDVANALGLQGDGSVLLVGSSTSSKFPTVSGATDSSRSTLADVYVMLLAPDADSIRAVSFVAGSGNEYGYSLVVDPRGSVYVAGWTTSPDLPVTVAAAQKKLGGKSDFFVARFDASLRSVGYLTWLGGSGEEGTGGRIAVNDAGEVCLVGYSNSTDYPVSPRAYNRVYADSFDLVVTKLSAQGDRIIFSTYLGGSGRERGGGVAYREDGSVWIVGDTQSPDLPTTSVCYDRTWNGNNDIMVAGLSPAGDSLLYMSYVGGEASDIGYAILVDRDSSLWVTGASSSDGFPTTTTRHNPDNFTEVVLFHLSPTPEPAFGVDDRRMNHHLLDLR